MSSRSVFRLVLVTVALAGAAFAQAAAESVLLNGVTSTSAARGATALSNTRNRAAGVLGNRLGSALSQPSQPSRPTTTTVVHPRTTPRKTPTGTPAPTNGSFVASVQGGAPVCAGAEKSAAPDSPATACKPAPNVQPGAQKSVITVTFPK
jgi:hypothetical protein